MSKFLAILIFILPIACEALSCGKYDPPNGVEIEVQSKGAEDAGWFTFSLPAVLDEQDLNIVVLWLYESRDKSSNEIAVPMKVKVQEGMANGEFHISSPWVTAEVTAKYGEGLCGPSLSATVNF